MAACPACGFENAESAKFCSECGAPLGVPAHAHREERKVVSVVFVDLVGSTARAESSDPEDVRALLRVYHERARDELEAFGGTVEKFIGDAVVAVFGAPVAHEDDPERAIRAALAVREAVARLNDEAPERDLHVRIAVNTGEALVSLDSSPREGEAMVAGDVMNTAARLQSAAPVDGILVGEHTHVATERAIVYREAPAVEAKGKAEPIPVWEAVEARSRLGVDLGGAGRAALVGRDAELQALIDALRHSRRERTTRLATLVGVPGIGKSRLVYELGRAADDDPELIAWRQGRSLPYGEGVSYWALGEIVKAQAGILESDSASATDSKLAAAVELLADENERAWVERHLRPLVGLGGEDVASGDRRGEAFAAWRRFLEVLAESGPTVLVFEDLHWADDGLLEFIEGLVDWVDSVPLLVVATARPELLDRRPSWGARTASAVPIALSPLADEDTAHLIHSLLDQPLLEAETQSALLERAAGNPLYAEEFVRMVEAGGSLERGLPESVQGIVAARIDLLPREEKELVQNAAVLGKVFWSDAVSSLGGVDAWQLTAMLRSLERKEFIRREQRSAVAGATQHAFVHALVRDAAYAQLPRSARAARHVAAAAWIETLPEDRAEDRAETLAHHYLAAIDLYEAAGEDASAVAVSAVPALREAGERALALSAFRNAERFLSRALELAPTGEEPPPELLLLAGIAKGLLAEPSDYLARASAAFERRGDIERAAEAACAASWHLWHASSAEAATFLERASDLVQGRPPSRAKALVVAEQARRTMLGYQYESAVELADQAAELARTVEDREIEADALVTGGSARASTGRREGMDLIVRGLDLVGHRGRVASRGYTNLAVAQLTFGELREGMATFERGLERAEREGDIQGAWFIRGNLLGQKLSLGEWEDALALSDLLLGEGEATRYQTSSAHAARAVILEARGDRVGAAADNAAALRLSRENDEAQSLWPTLISSAWLARRHGDRERATALIDEVVGAIAASESAGDPQEWQIQLVVELHILGRAEEAGDLAMRLPEGPWGEAARAAAERRFVAAADLLASMGEQVLQADLRAFAARELAAEGALPEAEEQLERARAFWTSVGATAYLSEADELFAAAS